MQASQRVLVVDDDPGVRRFLWRALEDRGYEVLVAEDGPEGLEMAKAHRPALILLDVGLPRLDGYGVCARLQDSPWTSHIPVLMLTGLAEGEDVVRGLEAGADAYMPKPFSVPELLARIRNLIARSRAFVYTTRRRVV